MPIATPHLRQTDDEVLTTTDTAKVLGISVRTAQLLIEGGRIPSWKTPGGHRRVYRSAVEALLLPAREAPQVVSATLIVVSSPDRQPVLRGVLEKLGHLSIQFHSDTWSAALAMAVRPPAVLVLDSDMHRDGAQMVNSLAMDSRFANAEFVVVVREGERRLETTPARVHLTTLDGLDDLLRRLTGDRPSAAAPVVEGGFVVAPNEASRLRAVQRLGIVDTPAEVSFDRVTSLAAHGLKSPVSLMTVLTADRQWFKSRQGLELTETPRSWAFCNHTLLQKGVFEVRDLAKHPSFVHNPAVADAPHFRFYAGAPVNDPDGFPIGSICVIDYRPRQLDKMQRTMLLDLAAIATDELKLRDLVSRN